MRYSGSIAYNCCTPGTIKLFEGGFGDDADVSPLGGGVPRHLLELLSELVSEDLGHGLGGSNLLVSINPLEVRHRRDSLMLFLQLREGLNLLSGGHLLVKPFLKLAVGPTLILLDCTKRILLEILREKLLGFIEVLGVLVSLGNGIRQVHRLLVDWELYLAETSFNDRIPSLLSAIGNVSVEYQGVGVGLQHLVHGHTC